MPNKITATRPGHRALRKGRQSIPGQIYLVTTVTHERRPVFSIRDCAVAASRLVADQGLWRDSKLLCWVLMPDHLHALVQLGEGEPLEKLVKRVKSVLARAANGLVGSHGAIWAPAFHDHALRSEDDLRAMARYVVANPVRAGLTTRIGGYPFWNASLLP